jgi:superfamily II DNA or RNA helicase
VAEKLVKADYRVAMTGTTHGVEVSNMKMEGYFGPITKITTTKKLMDDGHIAELSIKSLVLKHPPGTKLKLVADLPQEAFAAEMAYIVSHPGRNRFIKNLALSLQGNTLLLFQYVDRHGKVLHEMIQEKLGNESDRKLFFVFGGTDVEDREAVRGIVEKESNAIICASFGVFSTGVNIRNLHNIIFASPTKSKIRTLQSIGRGLRLGDDKTTATLYDLADDFREHPNDKPNYTLKHYAERMLIYHNEQFKVSHYKIDLD